MQDLGRMMPEFLLCQSMKAGPGRRLLGLEQETRKSELRAMPKMDVDEQRMKPGEDELMLVLVLACKPLEPMRTRATARFAAQKCMRG